MKYEDSIKKSLVGLIMLVALAVAITMIATLFIKSKNSGELATNTVTDKIITVPADPSTLPQKFPTDVPVEENAPILQNYNSVSPEGNYQATREFGTSKSIAENYTLYTNYLKNSNWETDHVINEPSYKVIFASRGSQKLQITLKEDDQAKTVTVSMTELALTE